jgi:hypothetical protein
MGNTKLRKLFPELPEEKNKISSSPLFPLIFGGHRFSMKVTAAFLILIAVLAAIILLVGPYRRITIYAHDTIWFLVQGDQLFKGYRPYVDYHSTHGFFPFLFPAIGLRIAGVSLWAVLIGQLLGAVLFGILFFRVAIARLGPYWAAGLGLTAFLMLISLTPLGMRVWCDFTCAMWYNTMGFIIEGIVFLYVFLPSSSNRLGKSVDCLIAAFCLAALFFLKLSFIIPTVGTLVVGTLLWPRTKGQRLEGVAVLLAACVMIAALAWVTGASVLNYVSFLLAIPTKVSIVLLASRYLQYTRTISVFLAAMLLAGWAAANARLLTALSREWLLAAMMAVTIMLSTATTCQYQEIMPLLGLIPVLLVAMLLRLASDSQLQLPRQTIAAVVIIGGVMLFHSPKDAVLSWGFNQIKVKTLCPQVELAEGLSAKTQPSLKMLEKFPRTYFEQISEAVTLIENAGTKPGEVLFFAGTGNDVTIFTNLRYALGSSTWWPLFLCETPESYPLLKSDMLADTKWILQERDDKEFWRFLMHYRGEYVRACFTPVSESPKWTLWKRIDRDESISQ